MGKLLKDGVDVVKCCEWRDCEVNCEHNCVDRDSITCHPKDKQHHRKLSKRCFGECPRFLFVSKL